MKLRISSSRLLAAAAITLTLAATLWLIAGAQTEKAPTAARQPTDIG